jgi:hypothetical protein
MSLRWLPGLACLLLVACGSSPAPEAQALPADASSDAAASAMPDAPADSPADAPFVAAAHPAAPHVTDTGGPTLNTPKVVTVTFASDPLAPKIDAFAAAVGASSYWKAATGEYAVAPLAFARSVHVPATPSASIDSGALETWLIGQLDGTHPEWGTPDAHTIYTIVYPVGMSITMMGQSLCSVTPAYHSEVKLGSGIGVPYAAMARCDPFLGLSGIDYITAGLSHEWVEASTDPFPNSGPAYYSPANQYNDWAILTGGELADMCTLLPDVYFKPADLPYTVQRSWSNAAAAEGHDPCVPAPAAPYFNAAPVLPNTVVGTYYGQSFTSEGLSIPLGKSKAMAVDLFSDAPTAGPWKVQAMAQGAAKLTFAWDKTSGNNGDVLQLTVTRVKDDPSIPGVDLFMLISTLGSEQHAWVGAVGN